MKSKSGGKFVIALIIAYLLLPLALTLIYSLFTEWMDIFPKGFTLRYYAEIFADPIFWASLARTVHMLAAYWGYCFISLHLGLHWSMMLGMMKNAAAPHDAPRWVTPLLRIAGAAAALLGAHALMRHNLLDYMFLRNQFVFFDTERPLYLFFLDYAAIMALWAWLAHYARLALIKVSARKK